MINPLRSAVPVHGGNKLKALTTDKIITEMKAVETLDVKLTVEKIKLKLGAWYDYNKILAPGIATDEMFRRQMEDILNGKLN